MELPAFILPLAFVFTAESALGRRQVVLVLAFAVHYFNRCFLFPLRMSASAAPMSLGVTIQGNALREGERGGTV